jgi:2-C-methyl-D-erythritol 4-phosphate cytidylyltransferase
VPISSTIKRVDREKRIVETVPREALWAAQTPQVSRRDWMLEAFAKRNGFAATDEAQLLERIGHKVAVVEGSPMNLKITTQEDFRIAEALSESLPRERSIGSLHPFADERFV